MERIPRLMNFWSRLPAFRVVAETEHLPTAAEKLGLTPPALSRAVKQVEEAVGRPLFERTGRRLELNPSGKLFLESVRTAMRVVDSGLETLLESELAGVVRVSSTGMFTPLAIAALLDLQAEHPRLRAHLTHLPDSRVPAALLRGELDVALLEHPTPDPEVLVTPLARCSYGIYCGRGHALHGAQQVAPEALADHPFVAPPSAPGRAPTDGWPPHLARTVAMTIVQVEVALRVCATGQLLSVLPDPVVQTSPRRNELWRLPLELIAPSTLHVVCRRPVGPEQGHESPADAVVAAAMGRLTEFGLPPLPGGESAH